MTAGRHPGLDPGSAFFTEALQELPGRARPDEGAKSMFSKILTADAHGGGGVIRKLLVALAFTGMVAGFAALLRDLYRFGNIYCPWAEAGGNCHAFIGNAGHRSLAIFGVCTIALAVLFLLPKSKQTDE